MLVTPRRQGTGNRRREEHEGFPAFVLFVLVEVDISGDPALERRYGHDIPVLLIDGVETARHRIDEADLVRTLTRAQAG